MKSSLNKNLLFVMILGFLLGSLLSFFTSQSAQAAIISCGSPLVNSGDTCAAPCTAQSFGNKQVCMRTGNIFSAIEEVASCIGNPIDCIASGISLLIAAVINGIIWLIGLFYSLAAAFTGLMLNLNYLVTQNPLVHYGWSIVRDFANLGFVLVLLVIAFATILRFESYGMKQLLWKLVVAAILVNFSLFFASMFIDFTNFLSQQFFDGTNNGFENAISGAFGADKILNPNQPPNNNVIDAAGTIMIVATNGMVAIIYMLMGVVIMATIGFMLLVRYVHLIFLLIIAPLAWLFWTFPDLSGHARTWWNSFLRWCFFAPASLFFIFISVQMAAWLLGSNIIAATTANSTAAQAVQGLTIIGNVVQSFANMFVVGAMLIGSLIIGDKFGVTGAQMGIKLAKKVSVDALGAVGMKGARAARRRVVDPAARKLSDAASEASGKVPSGKFARWTGFNKAATAALRGTAVGFGKLAGSGKEAQKKEAEEYGKGLAGMSKEGLQALAMSGTPAQIAEIAVAKARKGILTRLEAGQALKHAESIDKEVDILRQHPDLIGTATKYQPSTSEVAQGITAQNKFVSQSMRRKDIEELSDAALTTVLADQEMVRALATNTGILEALGERISDAAQKNQFKSDIVDMGIQIIPATPGPAQNKARREAAEAVRAEAFLATNEHWR